MISAEAAFIGLAGGLLGVLVGHLLTAALSEYLSRNYGEKINWLRFGWEEWGYLGLIVVTAFIAGIVPGLKAYRTPVAQNLVAE
jgi:ABC-type antimicrobial peptide transport system permease subunit